MTISVSAFPAFSPPRNQIDISVPVGAIMDTVSVWRVLSGQRTDLRAQPSSGFTDRTVFDYECPYGMPVTYGWEASYIDSSVITEVWEELWASLSAWTVSGGSWSVAAGALVWSGADSLVAEVSRDVAAGLYGFTFSSVPVGLSRIDFGGFYIDVLGSRLVVGGQSIAFVAGTTGWDVAVTESAVALTTSAGVFSISASVLVSKVSLVGAVRPFVAGLSWGSSGSGPGEFQGANLGVDSAGNVYVADTQNDRVQKFSPAGVFISQFGVTGSGNGQFARPQGVAVDSAGDVYVSDRSNNRIQKFTSADGINYTYVMKWGTAGSGNGQFAGPEALAVDSAGAVYVVDRNNYRIQKFTISGTTATFVMKWGSKGAGVGQFNEPQSIACAAGGVVYVAEFRPNNRIQKFTVSGVTATRTATWGGAGSTLGKFQSLSSVAVDGLGNVYATDFGDSVTPGRLQKFTSDGVGLTSFVGTLGLSAYEVNSVAVAPSGSVYIAENNTIHSFTQPSTAVSSVKMSSYGTRTTIREFSDPVTLSPVDGWLVHPAKPGLSFPLSPDGGKAGIREISEVGNQSNVTIHKILGSDTPLTTTNGNRSSDETVMTVAISTSVEEYAMKALLKDETPLLINIAPSMGIGFDYGFYQVGDTRRTRIAQLPDFQLRDYVLPLVAVQSPIVTQQNVGWSWATLASEFPTWAAVAAAFATWADVATNNRRPGF